MDEEEVDFLWDVMDDLETTLYRLDFIDWNNNEEWMMEDIESYSKKYGSRDADLWYVLYGVENTLKRLGFRDWWWDNDVMDKYAEKYGVYRGR